MMERSSSLTRAELIAQRMLKELLLNRSFQKYLIESTAEQLLSSDNTARGHHLMLSNIKFQSATVSRHAFINEHIDMLLQLLQLINEAFITSSNLAFCDLGAERNRDAAALFSARLQLLRFINTKHFQLVRFEQIVRRLCTLLRCFAVRISTPFQLANCAFFANSLCDLLYSFEEFCSLHEKDSALKFEQLRKAVDNFYEVIVLQLNKMIAIRLKEESESKKFLERNSPSKQTPQRPKSATTFRESEKALRSPGYLLPHDLYERRQTRLLRNATVSSSAKISQKQIAQDSMQRKTAHRLAHEITKKVLDDLSVRMKDLLLTG